MMTINSVYASLTELNKRQYSHTYIWTFTLVFTFVFIQIRLILIAIKFMAGKWILLWVENVLVKLFIEMHWKMEFQMNGSSELDGSMIYVPACASVHLLATWELYVIKINLLIQIKQKLK